MTIRFIASELHNLSVGGYFNGERFTKGELEAYIASMLRTGDKLYMEIALPDGRWIFKVVRYGESRDNYDYIIPDNREQEDRFKAELMV